MMKHMKLYEAVAANEGILLGPSGGAAIYAALAVAKRLTPNDTVVCIAPDSGERYLSSDLFEFKSHLTFIC